MEIDVTLSSPVSRTPRARQLESMFDIPPSETTERTWQGSIPLDDRPWNIGLIVGPSGSGKTTITKEAWGITPPPEWGEGAVVDNFAKGLSMKLITETCSSVGFNTIPAWLRPYDTLSAGEKFRASLARSLLESDPEVPLVQDEFTSVVDRQVAKIGSHAVQKWIRAHDRQFVAVSCHNDIEEWLQPDWVFEPATMTCRWRSVQPRPQLDAEIIVADRSIWPMFAPFHYLSQELHFATRCYVLLVNGEPAVFAGTLHRVHPKNPKIRNVHRVVTLPDWQGLGLAFQLLDRLGSLHKTLGYTFTINPAHPSFIRSFDKSPVWTLTAKPGKARPQTKTSGLSEREWYVGSRPSAGFKYSGPAWPDYQTAHDMTGLLSGLERV